MRLVPAGADCDGRKVFEHYCNSPVLAFYKRTLDEIGKERKHTLSAAEERILSMSSDVLGTPYKTFSLLNDADLRFGEITGEDGVKTELTHGNYIKFLESPKREVRKVALKRLMILMPGLRILFFAARRELQDFRPERGTSQVPVCSGGFAV